jgi:hypothetical protein
LLHVVVAEEVADVVVVEVVVVVVADSKDTKAA